MKYLSIVTVSSVLVQLCNGRLPSPGSRQTAAMIAHCAESGDESDEAGANESRQYKVPLDVIETSGARVSLYLASPDMIVVVSNTAKGAKDPLDDVASTNMDFEHFYQTLTGKERLPDKLQPAVTRSKQKIDSNKSIWRLPNLDLHEDTSVPDQDDDWLSTSSESELWWVEHSCHESWSNCYTSYTGDACDVIKETSNFVHKLYPYRGSVYHKLDVWTCDECDGTDATFCDCYWKLLNGEWIEEEQVGSIWASTTSTDKKFLFRSSLLSASGDGYHRAFSTS